MKESTADDLRRCCQRMYTDVKAPLPEVKTLERMVESLKGVRELVKGGKLEAYPNPDIPGGLVFDLNSRGRINIRVPVSVDSQGGKVEYRTKNVEIVPGTTLGRVYTAETNHFPNALLERLLQMHDEGCSQIETHRHLSEFYRGYGQDIPNYRQIITEQSKKPDFAESNLFLVAAINKLNLTGTGITSRMLPGVLDWYGQNRNSIGYGVVYTRMAELQKTLQACEPARIHGAAATLAQAQEHMAGVLSGRRHDWSMRFHIENGAIPICAMERTDPKDEESLCANGLFIYRIHHT